MNTIMNYVSTSIWAFFILQLINVILSTIKSVVTIKGKTWMAALINALYFGFYTFIVKSIGDADFDSGIPPIVIVALITIITNLIGVYISLKLLERVKKDDLWLFKVSVKSEYFDSFIKDLVAEELQFIILDNSWEKRKPVEIYLYNKDESRKATQIIKKYEDTKYCCLVTKLYYEVKSE